MWAILAATMISCAMWIPVHSLVGSSLHQPWTTSSSALFVPISSPVSTSLEGSLPPRRVSALCRRVEVKQRDMRMASVENIESRTRDEVQDVSNWWKQGYTTMDSESEYLLEPSMGSIPKDIEGTFFKNGAGKFQVGKDKMMHPFDGDGMVVAISFSEEGAYFRNRFVKTKGYMRELQAGKMLYRGFGNLPGGILRNAFRIGRKNLANTNIIMWAGSLLALWEGGLPHRLDPKSLETFGETKLGETIDERRQLFSAHPRVDLERKRLIGFGHHQAQELTIYEYDDKFRLIQSLFLKNIKGMMHDFVVTKNYYIFHEAPLRLNPLRWVLGLSNLGSIFEWQGDSREAIIHVVPRDPNKERKAIPVPASFGFHFSNGYEDPATGEVVFEISQRDNFAIDTGVPDTPAWESIDWGQYSCMELTRYRLDVSSPQAKVVEMASRCQRQVDFPIINPKFSGREHRYVFANVGAFGDKVSCPLQGIIKVDVREGTDDTWLPETYEFCGEPTFIPRKGAPEDAPEDFGYIANIVINCRDRKSELVILDAQNISRGPVCRLPIRGLLPHMLHGQFVPEAVYTPEQVQKSFALTDLFSRKGWNEAKSEFSGLGLNALAD